MQRYEHHRRSYAHARPVWLLAGLVFILAVGPARGQWRQWGGPHRNFTADATKLAASWPEGGPRKLWEKPIGTGYSAIVVDDGVLVTMCREDDKEIVVALDAKSGDRRWEHRYDGKPPFGMDTRFGKGPRGTPLIHAGCVYSVGVGAVMHCLNLADGKVIWSHDLHSEYGANNLYWGYASSPIAYNDTVIVPVGGRGHGLMAFNAKTGEPAWASGDFNSAYSAPILIDVDGQTQLVVVVDGSIVGVDPANGKPLWSHPHQTAFSVNASTPVWGDDNILFVASAYGTGARGLKLSRTDDGTHVEELWHEHKMGIHFGTALRMGDYVYASVGDNGPTFLAAINVKTGDIAWRKRNVVAKASGIIAGDRVIFIDEDGNLVLASVSPEDVTVHAQTQLFDSRSWTVPTLVGDRLYVRNTRKIVALDIG